MGYKRLFADDILKVIYAPHKAFKTIVENPRFIGPFVVLILFVAAQTGFFYTIVSKSYVEQTFPTVEQSDLWTENATLWTANSGVIISNNHDDFINGTYYGNSSIEFTLANGTQMWIELNDFESLSCYGPDGFKNLSLRIQLISPQLEPENATIYLYSLSPSNYFYYNLTEEFSNSTVDVWNNLTIPVGSGNWASGSAAVSWENITGLKLDFQWPSNSNITLLADGIFFRGIFKTVIETGGSAYITSFVLTAFTQFIFQWLLLTGLLYVIVKGFKGNVTWRVMMVSVGFLLVTMAVQAAINIAVYSTLPPLYYPLEVIGGVPGETEVAYQTSILESTALASAISGYLQGAIYIWTIGLCGFATRVQTGFGWPKSLLASAAAFLLTIIILGFILG